MLARLGTLMRAGYGLAIALAAADGIVFLTLPAAVPRPGSGTSGSRPEGPGTDLHRLVGQPVTARRL